MALYKFLYLFGCDFYRCLFIFGNCWLLALLDSGTFYLFIYLARFWLIKKDKVEKFRG